MIAYIFFLILIISCITFSVIEKYEEPSIFKKFPRLYPIQDINKKCKEQGYKIASMPTICYKKDGTYDKKSNCMCMDDNGYCTVCYDSVNIKTHNFNIINSIKYRMKKK
jgi:hypothetical protein